jgi:hypothetical protein
MTVKRTPSMQAYSMISTVSTGMINTFSTLNDFESNESPLKNINDVKFQCHLSGCHLSSDADP